MSYIFSEIVFSYKKDSNIFNVLDLAAQQLVTVGESDIEDKMPEYNNIHSGCLKKLSDYTSLLRRAYNNGAEYSHGDLDAAIEEFQNAAQDHQSRFMEYDDNLGQPEQSPDDLDIDSGEMVVMFSLVFERSRWSKNKFLEKSISTAQEIEQGILAIAELCDEGKIEAFNFAFSPSSQDEMISSNQLLQFYPNLIPV